MSQPVWITAEGNLGIYPESVPLLISLFASPVAPAGYLSYQLLSGTLPQGTKENPIKLDAFGNITGTPVNVASATTSTFTVRVKDELNNIRDRTFTIGIVGVNNPKFIVPSGSILNVVDSLYVDYHVDYTNPVTTNTVTMVVSSGSLPPGLYLDSIMGAIKGYPEIPLLPNGSPTTITYSFSLQLRSELGDDLVFYSITIRNHQLNNPPNTRTPVILNTRPLIPIIPVNDEYFDYYLLNDKQIPIVRAFEYFSFKVMAKDFDNNDVTYQFGNLPTGVIGDSNTGWITGTPVLDNIGIFTYLISVCVAKKDTTAIVSEHEYFPVTISYNIPLDIKFTTDSDLGVIYNGTISNLLIEATSQQDLYYEITTGSLPPNLKLLRTGEIVGRVSHQPTDKLLLLGDTTEFNFTVQAYSGVYSALRLTKTFTLVVEQYYPEPIESIYFKASPAIKGKKIIQSLLTNSSLIPYEYLYRPDDIYYGKAHDVSIIQAYGLKSSTVQQYIDAIQENHYWRKIILGSLQTAVATDDYGNIIYEVVYSKIIDDLENDNNKSLPKKLTLRKPVSLDLGPWLINNSDIKISQDSYRKQTMTTSLSPGQVRDLYPASLQNMRNEITDYIPQNTDSNLLPKWMTTQQTDSQTLGFVQAWVICYTKPGYSQTIKNLINNNWNHSLNEIDFTIDRYYVDKSATYDWNTNLSYPAWDNLPSSTPAPNPINKHDVCVLFPRKTIFPTEIEQ
jgi:hypothetical protein